MSNAINSKISTGFVVFTFTDDDGEVFAKVKVRPSDPRLIGRCKNIAEFFTDLSKQPAMNNSVEGAEKYEQIVADKFCEFFGYDCRESLFGMVAATDVMSDGRIFANHVLDAIVRNIGPEVEKRRRANIEKYTAKYADKK